MRTLLYAYFSVRRRKNRGNNGRKRFCPACLFSLGCQNVREGNNNHLTLNEFNYILSVCVSLTLDYAPSSFTSQLFREKGKFQQRIHKIKRSGCRVRAKQFVLKRISFEYI